MMRRLILVALIDSTVTFRLPQSVGRRTFLLGAAATAFVQQPATAKEEAPADIDRVLDRAKRNALTTDNVIYRAMTDNLVNPREIEGCSVLDAIYKVDLKAAEEIRLTNEALLKFASAANDAERRNLEGNNPTSLKESYDIGRLMETRIRERASLINFKLARECVNEKDSEDRFDKRMRDRGDTNRRGDRLAGY